MILRVECKRDGTLMVAVQGKPLDLPKPGQAYVYDIAAYVKSEYIDNSSE